MLSRCLKFAALALAVCGFAAPARAADEPSVLVRVQSVNDLLKTAEFVGSLVPEDQREQVKQMVDFAKSVIDEKKGLEGIDVKNPIGLYASLNADNPTTSPVVGLIPVADKDTLLNALKERVKLEIKEKDGLYETTVPDAQMAVYFRFANNYAYVSNQPESIDPKGLPKPADVLGQSDKTVTATVRIDRLPEQAKKMAIGFLEAQLAQGKDAPVPNETKAIKAFKDQAIDDLTRTLQSVLMDGEKLSLHLNADPKTEEFALELELTGKSGSKLAKDLKSISENKSVVAGAIGSADAAMAINVSVALAPDLKKLFGPVVDDVLELAKKEANVPGEFQTKAEPLLKALTPSLKAGDLDAGLALHGPDKDDRYTVVFGLKLAEGKKVEDAIRTLVTKELPPEIGGVIKVDAEDLTGGAKLHVIQVGQHLDEKMAKVFGKSDAYLSFRDDLLVLAFGPQGKEAVTKAVASKPADVGVVQFKMQAGRIAAIAGDTADELAAAKAAVKKVFGDKPPTKDGVVFAITGGDSLKIKIGIQSKAIQFLAETSTVQKKDN
ncbi:MAG TPA: hypothetical protein VM597_08095 [Gemmataceae bacterium]|jgi:hypothetical protein|nr:hypothetical protein [Gemmataceae bacterium]